MVPFASYGTTLNEHREVDRFEESSFSSLSLIV